MKVISAERPEDESKFTFATDLCPTCKAKPGTPALCESCLHNRALISVLADEINYLMEVIDVLSEARSFRKFLPILMENRPTVRKGLRDA